MPANIKELGGPSQEEKDKIDKDVKVMFLKMTGIVGFVSVTFVLIQLVPALGLILFFGILFYLLYWSTIRKKKLNHKT